MGRVGDVEIVQGQLEIAGIELDPRAAAIAELLLPNGQWMVDSPDQLRCNWCEESRPERTSMTAAVDELGFNRKQWSSPRQLSYSQSRCRTTRRNPELMANRPAAISRCAAGSRDRIDFRAR